MTNLGERLWTARRDGKLVEVAPGERPGTMDEAYAVQSAAAEYGGLTRIGWKVGFTSEEAMRLMGGTEPASAPMYREASRPSPATMPIHAHQFPAVECEFALRLDRDLPARTAPYTRDDVAAAVDGVAGAVEVVASRLKGGFAGAGAILVTADGVGNFDFVHGSWHPDWQRFDLAGHSVTLTINGEPAAQGTGSLALGHPLTVLEWLANQQSRTGRGLRRGEVITTGSCTGIKAVAPGDVAVADFGLLGRVELTFVAA